MEITGLKRDVKRSYFVGTTGHDYGKKWRFKRDAWTGAPRVYSSGIVVYMKTKLELDEPASVIYIVHIASFYCGTHVGNRDYRFVK